MKWPTELSAPRVGLGNLGSWLPVLSRKHSVFLLSGKQAASPSRTCLSGKLAKVAARSGQLERAGLMVVSSSVLCFMTTTGFQEIHMVPCVVLTATILLPPRYLFTIQIKSKHRKSGWPLVPFNKKKTKPQLFLKKLSSE